MEVNPWLYLVTCVGIFYNGYQVGVWKKDREEIRRSKESLARLRGQDKVIP